MKGILLPFLFIQIILGTNCLFAQEVEIVDIKGQVFVKKKATLTWQRARLHMLLRKSAEVKTASDSECTLAFDGELNSLLTLKENSRLKISRIASPRITLPEGRIFALLEQLGEVDNFEVVTPSAVAGVRGTGWSVEVQDNGSGFFCFEDLLYVQGINQQGQITGKQEVPEGFGINVTLDGKLGDLFELPENKYLDWKKAEGRFEQIKTNLLFGDIEDISGIENFREDQLEEQLQLRNDTAPETGQQEKLR
jgi:hypothetical protein